MGKEQEEWTRQLAVLRYRGGEQAKAIWVSLSRSRRWFYKWLKRSREEGDGWYANDSRSHESAVRTAEETEAIVEMVRLNLYNHGQFCGAQAIRWELEDLCVEPLPSERTIGRILVRRELTHGRAGRYESKGKKYPAWPADRPGKVHQTDFVGPCYIKGVARFYSLNTVDVATGRCAVEPAAHGKQDMIAALWATWTRLGYPQCQQVDNEAVFYGSQAHPHGMGKLIRLCLHQGVEPCFIPIREPWYNGVVEKFNDVWRQKFLGRVLLESVADLQRESLAFEQRHNSRYRYSKLGGKTPLQYLASMDACLRFPSTSQPPKQPLPKPETGRYHVMRFIRSDGLLNIFGEQFHVPQEAVYEYVRATIDVAQQRLFVYLDNKPIDECPYALR
jgi:transposase InsO family protein